VANEIVSVNSAGAFANDESFDPNISGDGRYVVYHSWATNLSSPSDGGFDVYLYDRLLDTTELISVGLSGANSIGTSIRAEVSDDGRYVVFESDSTNLVSGDLTNRSDIFLYDRQTGSMQRVSENLAGGEANGNSESASISADGRFVAFLSNASDLVVGDTNGRSDVFLWDRVTGDTQRVSLTTAGAQTSLSSFSADISGDGRYIAFDQGNDGDLYLYDRLNGTVEFIADQGRDPSLSHDGQVVAFASQATLTPNSSSTTAQVFVYDRTANQLELASVSTTGGPMDGLPTSDSRGDSAPISISGDGQTVAFATRLADNLVNGFGDTVYLYSRNTQSVSALDVPFSGVSPSLSYDASVVAVDNRASNDDQIYVAFNGVGNNSPTVALSNAISSIESIQDTSNRIKVADIVVTDDLQGFNILTLAGTDSSLFEIFDGSLFLKAGVNLSNINTSQLSVQVWVDDGSILGAPDDNVIFELTVTQPVVPDDFADSFGDVSNPFGQLSVEGAVSGNLEVIGDRDWFEVNLIAGQTVQFNLVGRQSGAVAPLSDPILTLYDSAGDLLDIDDDGGDGLNSRLTFTATSSGTHFVEVGGFADTETGAFRLSANLPPNANDDVFAAFENSLDGDFKGITGNLFAENGFGTDSHPQGETFTITQVNGEDLIVDAGGIAIIDVAAGGFLSSTALAIIPDTGTFAFLIDDAYDFLPVGETRTETFTYTIEDADGAADTATVSITITGIDSNDLFNGTNAADTIRAGIGNDIVRGQNGSDRLFGDNGVDRLFGGNQNDVIRGGNQNDFLFGDNGNDRMFGDGGNDVLTGGLGRDIVNGGAGRDKFDYNRIQESRGAARDKIDGFRHNQDDIDLRTIDANTTVGGNQRFKFVGDDGFSRTAGEVRTRDVGGNITKVEGDVNGDGRADFTIDVVGGANLTAGDFLL